VVSQVTDRGYTVKEVSVRLGIKTELFYDCVKQFKKLESVHFKESDEARENLRLKAERSCVTEERDIYPPYFVRNAK
jgi:transposase-like protein